MAGERKIYGDYVNTNSAYLKSQKVGKGYATTELPTPENMDKWLRSLTDFETVCFAFSEIFGKAIYDGMGLVAEKFIAHELRPFLEQQNIASEDTFLDDSIGVRRYTDFLHEKNPDLSRNSDSILKKAVPDILIHSNKLKEFYEIKPDSADGRSAGREKLRDLIDIYSNPRCNLPYQEGRKFIPPDHIELGVAIIEVDGFAFPVKIALGLRKSGALILYELCIGTNWKLVLFAEAVETLLYGVYKVLKGMLTKSKEFFDKLRDEIEKEKEAELPVAAYGALTIVLGAILLAATSEVSIPVILFGEAFETLSAVASTALLKKTMGQ